MSPACICPTARQHMAFDTLQDHVAANCTSDLLYQGALLGKSRSVYEGTIRAWPGAQKTNAYQSNRNLLLSQKARADSLPTAGDRGQRPALYPRRDREPGG